MTRNMWRNWDFGFGTRWLFDSIDREFEEAEEMLNSMFRTVSEANPTNAVVHGPYYYGYQITVGLDGRPRVKEFGNMKPIARGLVEQSKVRDPLVDTVIDNKDNTLTITTEMPGVTKQDIKVKVSPEYVSIHAEKGEKKYHADIPVDVELDEKSARAIYSNGILELKIKLKTSTKSKETEVRVE
ncbi:MAG TPA: archaeal heat shock protein Hsp20 [Nitrososphaera sp.]|jgi:HSP20 family protein